jgi:hypothetical protein
VTGRKITPKNDLFLNCRRKTKQLSKKELSNVAPASVCLTLPSQKERIKVEVSSKDSIEKRRKSRVTETMKYKKVQVNCFQSTNPIPVEFTNETIYSSLKCITS